MKRDFLTDFDIHLFNEGTHNRIYERLGAHPLTYEGKRGTFFAVWAPNARSVSVIGDFNGWKPAADTLSPRGSSGIWHGFVAGVEPGELYKLSIETRAGGRLEKTDPCAFATELRPRTAAKVWDLSAYEWQDDAWMEDRGEKQQLGAPISVYEVHLGSWMRIPEEDNRWLSYRELAPRLADYVRFMNFTHVELLPVAEHPFDGSWGYQVVNLFAPTSRFGTPDDFMYFVDYMHQQGIGVILDWVPAHFPRDAHGLAQFDGTHLFEHEDPRLGEHRDWGTLIYNYGRYEVSNFLISNALFWLDKYHIDGLRVDAVASMIYLDYSRKEGEWVPNKFGGRENLEALSFLRRLNEQVYGEYPDVMTIAEESTSWPSVSRPVYLGGLGFGYKWDMGWMHDTLSYMLEDPVHRKYHQDKLTFRMLYAFQENFMLPLSHDEVVHGKASLLSKMPGDDWQKFANLRCLFGLMYGQAGKKLVFMGGEFGQWREWDYASSLDWHLLDYPLHKGMQLWLRDLNRVYREEPGLHELDCEPGGFEWIDCSDASHSVISWLRRGKDGAALAFVFNLTPVPRERYRIGVPKGGIWSELLNSNAEMYGGTGAGNYGSIEASEQPCHGQAAALDLHLPPLSLLVLRSG